MIIRCYGFALTNKRGVDLGLWRIMGYRGCGESVLEKHGFRALCCRGCSVEQGGMDVPLLLLHGSIYYHHSTYANDCLDSLHRLHDMLMVSDGNYALVYISKDGTVAFARDPLGSRPLYYEHDGSYGITIASDKRVLNRYIEVEPGILYVKKPDAEEVEGIWFSPLVYTPGTQPDIRHAIEHTRDLLMRSIARRLHGRRRAVLGLSGIDSMVLAVLAGYALDEVIPVTVCTKGSYDEMNARYLKEMTGLNINTMILDESDVLNTLDDLVRLNVDLDFTNAMDVSISCVIYALARFARDNRIDTLILGQLADELFGGYARYMRCSMQDLNMILLNDLRRASHDLCRDESIASSMHVDLALPYASTELASYVINLPAEFKVDAVHGVRKLLLRQIAESIGIAHDVAYREKKAMQYSSGIFKTVKRLIRAERTGIRRRR